MEDIWPTMSATSPQCWNCSAGSYDISLLNTTITSILMPNSTLWTWRNTTQKPAEELDYLNVTKEFPIEYAIPLYGYAVPFLLLITIVANTLIVVVLSKRHMRTPTNAVLMAMALSDMFTLLFPSPWLFYMYTFGNHYKPLSPVSACFAWNVMYEVIPSLFHTASIWLTLALAVQRYIYVCHAPVARTWCTMPRVLKCIGLITCLAVLHQSTRFLDRVYVPITITWRGQPQVSVCQVSLNF
ncbi:hypothetical protein O3M35_005647 [Rhynocoris fuscipes]|uniref:G-protein coupled receptors family 1 profile domain-containing protein n=1 Tax=Rhynocoris fuscipes TaxID=488301 RepID=A0AAW1DMN5_9HEMI